jgi:hypothetical protein
MKDSWGLRKEDGLLTFKILIIPLFTYLAPIWYPLRSKLASPVLPFQKLQNTALRTVTECHAAASEQQLYEQCKVLPVKDHLELQYA